MFMKKQNPLVYATMQANHSQQYVLCFSKKNFSFVQK